MQLQVRCVSLMDVLKVNVIPRTYVSHERTDEEHRTGYKNGD